eukprot:2559112-Alexandrium_andersonii.AAC.1
MSHTSAAALRYGAVPKAWVLRSRSRWTAAASASYLSQYHAATNALGRPTAVRTMSTATRAAPT